MTAACTDTRGSGDDAPPPSEEPVAFEPDWLPVGPVYTLANDATHLYFVVDGTLSRVPLSGTPSEEMVLALASGDGHYRSIKSITLGDTDVVLVISDTQAANGDTTYRLVTVATSGGPILELATSQDPRSFLGVTIDGATVYYSTFTAIYAVPLAGGSSTFVAQSPESVRYWARTPVIHADAIYWAESTTIFRRARGASSNQGTAFAELPGEGKIISAQNEFVVAVAPLFGSTSFANQFVVIDPDDGAITSVLPVGFSFESAAANATDLFTTAFDHGVTRIPRDGSAPVQLSAAGGTTLTATDDALYIGTEMGIARQLLP